MKNKINWVVIGILLPLILFFINFSYAKTDQTVNAHITVYPYEKLQCWPNVIYKGNYDPWIFCKMQLSGATIQQIDPLTVNLGVVNKTCKVLTDTYFFNIIDDTAFIRFDKGKVEQFCFGPPNVTTNFTLNVSGVANNFPFSGYDKLNYIVDACYGKWFIPCIFANNCQWLGDLRIGHCESRASQTSTTSTSTTSTSTSTSTTTISNNCQNKNFISCNIIGCKWTGDLRTGHCERKNI